jgi:hypothetical protein
VSCRVVSFLSHVFSFLCWFGFSFLCCLVLYCSVLLCVVLCCVVLSRLGLLCIVLSCALSCLVFSCLALSWLLLCYRLINPFPMNCKRLLCNMWGCCRFSCHSFATDQVKSEKNVIIGTKNFYDSCDSEICDHTQKALNKSSSLSTVLYRKDGSALSWKAKCIEHVNFSSSGELYTSAKMTPPSSFSSESYQPQ